MTATDESGDDHGFLPAVRDFPRGYGEASWWPFVGALGATGLYVGASLYILGRPDYGLVPSMWGPVVFGLSVLLFLFGVFGWLWQAFVSDYWSNPSHNAGKSLRWGMLLFLGTDIATFGAGFTYYFFIRSHGWPPQYLPEGLLSVVLAINTVLLVTSSFTLHWGETQLKKGNRSGFLWGLAVTVLLGALFVGGQAYEYSEFITKEGFTLTSGIFGSAFFGLTGLHGMHVSLGVLLLAILTVRAVRGQYSADRHVSLTTVSWYWHFVDAVWLFLVTIIYVGSVLGTEFSPF